jgi:acyl-CoA synthetase (NDP forming)
MPHKIISMRKLGDRETWNLLRKWGIPVVEHHLAKGPVQAAGFADREGYPVVMKVSSGDVIHKTEAGAVHAGVNSRKEAVEAYEEIIGNVKKSTPGAKIDGVLVQKMAKGHELIVGAKEDPQFGPVLMFGMGGIFVEALKDVTFRVIPVTSKDVKEMIQEIRGYRILQGVRGQKPIDFRALEGLLLKVSDMVWKTKTPKIRELDINPLFASSEGVLGVDVRVITD